MKKQIDHVAEFHDVFQIGNELNPKVDVGSDVYTLRYNLMREENEEYLDACEQGDMVEVADALGDQLYILCGTILKHGLQHKIEEIFDEIQRSNMSKLDTNGEPIFRKDGKIIKGENYFKPNIKEILGDC